MTERLGEGQRQGADQQAGGDPAQRLCPPACSSSRLRPGEMRPNRPTGQARGQGGPAGDAEFAVDFGILAGRRLHPADIHQQADCGDQDEQRQVRQVAADRPPIDLGQRRRIPG